MLNGLRVGHVRVQVQQVVNGLPAPSGTLVRRHCYVLQSGTGRTTQSHRRSDAFAQIHVAFYGLARGSQLLRETLRSGPDAGRRGNDGLLLGD